MEAIGAVASLMQITDAALGLASNSRKLYKAYKDAPEAVGDVNKQATSIQLIIDAFTLLRPRLDGTQHQLASLPLGTKLLLDSAISHISDALLQFQAAFHCDTSLGVKKKDRIRWALWDRKSVEEAQKKLDREKLTLLVVFQLLNTSLLVDNQAALDMSLASLASLGQDVRQSFQRLAIQSPSDDLPTRSAEQDHMEKRLCGPNHIYEPARSSYLAAPDRPSATTVLHRESIYSHIVTPFQISKVSTSGSLARRWNDKNILYSASAKARLPWLLGERYLIFELKVRHSCLAWSNFSLLAGYIGISKVHSEDSQICQAIKGGDLDTVRSLLIARKAGPNDVYTRNLKIGRSSDLHGIPWHLFSRPGYCENQFTLLSVSARILLSA